MKNNRRSRSELADLIPIAHFFGQKGKEEKQSQIFERQNFQDNNIMCSPSGMSRVLAKRVMAGTTIKKVYAVNEKSTPIAGEKLSERCNDVLSCSPSRFDSITFSGIETTAPSIPCQERHSGSSMDRLLREELASPEPLMKPRRRCSLYADSHFDRIFAEDSSEPLAMPRRSM